MRTSLLIMFLISWGPFEGLAQVKGTGRIILRNGDTLQGRIEYKQRLRYKGVHLTVPDQEKSELIPSKRIQTVTMEGKVLETIHISEEYAGVESYSLAKRVVNGPMTLYQTRFQYKACTCNENAQIKEGWIIRKEGNPSLYLIQKKRWFDRIENPEEASAIFEPIEGIMQKIRDGKVDYSNLPEIVKDYNKLVLRTKTR